MININIIALDATAHYEDGEFVGMHLEGTLFENSIPSLDSPVILGNTTPLVMDLDIEELNSLSVFLLEESSVFLLEQIIDL